MGSAHALITGASSGLGLALARCLTGEGTVVYGVSKTRRHWREARTAVSPTGRFFLYEADLCHEESVRRVIKRIYAKAGRLDIVINSAGSAHRLTRLEDLSLKAFRTSLEDNLISAFLVLKHVVPIMKKDGSGLIINISSMAEKRAVPRLGAYSAAKFGIVALSQSLAKENPEGDIQCITVCPAGINTRMRRELFGLKDARNQQSPDAVARVVLDIIKGKIIVASGGDVIIRDGAAAAVMPPPPR